MTSEGEPQKTSEFLRRRKLRLQQVREQSKDIAKIIRQRAKVEKLRQVVELDAKKETDYLERQDKVVKKLKELYSRGLENVGTSHKIARGLTRSDNLLEKTDLSHIRGKEAAAELKRNKQKKLNEQKKSLDRKVQAREAANVISREKSTKAVIQLSTKSSSSKFSDESKSGHKLTSTDKSMKNLSGELDLNKKNLPREVSKNDMATQWDAEIILPNEWEPNVPALTIPKDDSIKESNDTENQKQKKPNLFALSDEMPSSLRGTHNLNENEPFKPSLTLVSEYIQNRALRLREPEVSNTSKKQSEDLQTLKQTILRSRPNTQGSAFSNICHVLEGQVIPVPTWHAETCCQYCSARVSQHKTYPTQTRQFANITNSQINKIFSSIRPGQPDLVPTPVLKRIKSFVRKEYSEGHKLSANTNNNERLFREYGSENGLTKKKSVTMYNHSTRDTRDVPFADERIVIRDTHSDKDAYSEALNETTASSYNHEKHNKKIQDMTNKIAMTRQHVEKEYKDTIAFLNGLPRNRGPKPINKAYKDDHRLQMQRDNRQRTLQHEFKNAEKECKQQGTLGCKTKPTLVVRNKCKKSILPSGANIDDNFNERDFQYSWMPVPESDGNLAVHTIPTTVKEAKSGNSVKFSKVDSYHEYRSRHKHTPPTKDTSSYDKKTSKRYVEAVIIQQKDENSLSGSSVPTDNSSTEDLRLESKENKNMNDDNESSRDLTDAERIIIYKILDCKNRKNEKSSKKLKVDDIIRSSNGIENEIKVNLQSKKTDLSAADNENALLVDEIDEGIYKIDKGKGDNITSMYYTDNPQESNKNVVMNQYKKSCSCKDNSNGEKQLKEGPCCKCDGGNDNSQSRKKCVKCKCNDRSTSKNSPTVHPSANTSTMSFKTAANVKPNVTPDDVGYVKLIDEGGLEKGNIYIGTTGFLKDDAYEVVIQLRKKSITKEDANKQTENVPQINPTSDNLINNTEKLTVSLESRETIQQKATSIDHYAQAMDPQNNLINPVPVIESNPTLTKLNENHNKEQSPDSDRNHEIVSAKTKHTKSISTSFKDSVPIPVHVPKTDPIPKPATSTYTQTNLASPNPRPVFFHMSSSTSTAYMSPPEVVLPNFFKRGYESYDEVYQNIDLHDDRHAIYGERPCCEVYSKCRCRRCVRANNAYSSKIQTELEMNRLKTPPNTARSFEIDEYDSCHIYKVKRRSTHSSPVSNRVPTRYHKCKTRGNSKLCCKYYTRVNKNKLVASKQVLPKRNVKIAGLYTRKNKISSNGSKNTSKSYLNPMIKYYINKLLSLNREGIKAIQILNQECSSVNTPADSIINIPSNVPNNKTKNDVLNNKISLEEIKNILKKQVVEDYAMQQSFKNNLSSRDLKAGRLVPKNIKPQRKNFKKKHIHKVKYLNISKKIGTSSCDANFTEPAKFFTNVNKQEKIIPGNLRSRNHCINSSEHIEGHNEFLPKNTASEETSSENKILKSHHKHPNTKLLYERRLENQYLCEDTSSERPKSVLSSGSTSPDSHVFSTLQRYRTRRPINSSTQTSRTIDTELNFMKLAEDKLQNMEKIANLTEKCTKRLSNLAKVLEEVRKNKSLAYGQISTSDSTDTDQKPDKIPAADTTEQQSSNSIDIKENTNFKSLPTVNSKVPKDFDSTDYEALLFGIPKPGYIKSPRSTESENGISYNNVNEAICNTPPLVTNADYRGNNNTKPRSKPPPALLRIHLKRPEENVVPHELSTVIEVDSPMSVKLKNQSSNMETTNQSIKFFFEPRKEKFMINDSAEEHQINQGLRQNSVGVSNNSKVKIISTDSSDDSKLRMMDLNQFNEIMLKPFISLQEYAQECYVDNGVSKRENVSKDNLLVDEISSLHSDGSLPDVVAELLKRKLITEPFKFDTASNVNSTTVSSESTLSVLALSRVLRDKHKSKILENKENVVETSDTLSISSNPDLENAFKKLGMGWASSTLKKTKERLALSSSSNTSSSSLSQYKFKNSTKQDVPTIVTDAVSSVPNLSKKIVSERLKDISKNAEQQTSFTNSMTVKEFLTNELAKKITFTNKSIRNETNEEFVSLFETKMPEELKNSSQVMVEENSGDSVPSGNNNRARTSTPVQIFKSAAYQSSSSSNISNGLFSNADDLSSVKLTSTSMRYHSTSEKDELTIPNFSLKLRKPLSDGSKTDSY